MKVRVMLGATASVKVAEAVDAMAKRRGISRASMIRELIILGYNEARRKEREATAQAGVDQSQETPEGPDFSN